MNQRKKVFTLFMLLSMLLGGCAGGDSSSLDASSSTPGSSASIATSLSSSETSVSPEKRWNVSFDLNLEGAPTISDQSVLHGDYVDEPTFSFTPSNDRFLGWFKDQYALVEWDFYMDTVTADRTLFGGWQSIIDRYNSSETPSEEPPSYDYYDPDFFPTTFAVTFNTNYEGGPVIERQVIENTMARAPSVSRTGFALVGWYTDLALTQVFDFETTITGALTLYAKWDPLTVYTITLDLNYLNAPAATTVQGFEGTKLQRPADPIRGNYDFLGWYKDSATTQLWNFSSDLITANMTLFARWARQPLPGVYVLISDAWLENNATFVLWHGTGTVNKNGVATGVPNEYYFDNVATSYLALKRNVNNTTVGQVYNIAPSGGWGSVWNQIVVSSSTPKTGSLSASDGNYVTLQLRDNSVDENLTLYTVTFDFNYQGSPAVQTKTVLHGRTVTPITQPTRNNYNFIGWSTVSSHLLSFNFSTPIEADTYLYAIWEEKPPLQPVDVSFNYNYQGSPSPVVVTGYVGELLTQPSSITRDGYTLSGWYREASLVTAWNFASDTVTAAMTLYAKWSEILVPSNNGVYVIVNDAWGLDNATFELEFTNSPNGRRTVAGVATGVPNEYFFEEVPLNAMILMRKVGGVQRAKIYNIATWVQTGPDYRNFGTVWNRVVVNSGLANNVANEPATNAVSYDIRPNPSPASRHLLAPVSMKERFAYEN